MATQTVRTIYEAVVNGAQANLGRLARETDKAADSVDKLDKSLDSAGKKTVKPKIDIDLQAAEKDVKRLADELEKLEANPVDPAVRVDIADSEAKIEALVDELDKLEKMDPSPQVTADTERAEAQLEGLMNRIEEMNRLEASAEVTVDIERARAELDSAEGKLKALQGAKAEMVVTADAGAAEEVFDDLDDAGADAGAQAGEEAGNAIIEGLNSTPIIGAVSGILVGVGAYLGKQLMDDIQNAIRNEDVFGASTGLDEATARKFGTAAGLAYSNAWGDSLEANMGAAESALENALVLPDSTGREIQGVIEQLTAVSEILGSDITETAEAAGNMIKNGLAKDATEAFDIIVSGQQEGLNRSEDWLDTLREYSGMFESIGLSGAEAGGLIEQAMDAGARNSDVAADALKEFSIRAQDDSKATNNAFESMGLNADEMGEKIAKGGDTAKGGLDTVLDGLRDMEDPIERNAAGVALFGTMWEDMGNGAGILAMDLDGLSDSWVNVGDTTEDAMTRMSENAATAWESTKRTFETSLDTVLGGLAIAFEEPLGQLSTWMSTNTNDILGFLLDMGYGFFDLARAAVEFAATTVEVMGDVAGSMDGIVDGVGKAVEALGHLTGDQDMIDLGLSIQGAAEDMTTFADNADGAAEVLRTEVGGALDAAERKFEEFTGPALLQTSLNDAINVMIGRVDEFVEHVGGVDATVDINGEALPAEEALNALIEEVAASNGTLEINGETVLAEDALDHVMGLADEGIEIEVTANTGPTEQQINSLITGLQNTAEGMVEIPVGADTTQADTDIGIWGSGLNDVPAKVFVEADLYGVEATMESFYAEMMEQDWTVDINGETVDAQQALGILLDEVNNGSGTVTINGTTFPADTSLMALIEAIQMSEGTVTIDGDPTKANNATAGAKAKADGTTGTIDVEADTSSANSSISTASRTRHATIDVNAETAGANQGINNAARTRYSTIRVSYSVVGGVPSMRGPGWQATGAALGARLPGYGSGYASGYGVVPGPSAPYGVDNVLWPSYAPMQEGRATGGPILSQPLAGGEWVVNPVSSRQHDSLLSAINAGATRSQIAASFGGGGSSGPSVLTLDGAALGAIASAVRTGASQAQISVGPRALAGIHQGGASASRAFGGR